MGESSQEGDQMCKPGRDAEGMDPKYLACPDAVATRPSRIQASWRLIYSRIYPRASARIRHSSPSRLTFS